MSVLSMCFWVLLDEAPRHAHRAPHLKRSVHRIPRQHQKIDPGHPLSLEITSHSLLLADNRAEPDTQVSEDLACSQHSSGPPNSCIFHNSVVISCLKKSSDSLNRVHSLLRYMEFVLCYPKFLKASYPSLPFSLLILLSSHPTTDQSDTQHFPNMAR